MRIGMRGSALLVLAAALPGACAGDDKPTVSARSASASVAASGGEGTAMRRPALTDLAWLDRLVAMLHTRTTRKEDLAVFFGIDPAGVASDGWSTVTRYGLVRVRIFDLPHIAVDVALEAEFADGSRPRLADLEARLGSPRPMPRRPDDFSGGDQVAFYPPSGSSPAFVRVFAELERGTSTVARLHIDRALPAAPE